MILNLVELSGASDTMADHKHVLLTALGKVARETTYELSGNTVTEPLAPLALVRLVDAGARPQHVVALVTEGAAETTWPVFREGIQSSLGIDAEQVRIPNGVSTSEIGAILDLCADALRATTEVTLDITQGLRHFPFIMYALGVYLQTLRDVRIRAVYYGVLELPGDTKQIIDLGTLLTLPDWFFATRMFRDTGATRAMAELVNTFVEQVQAQARRSDNDPAIFRLAAETKRLVKHLQGVSFAYESGMPLELGRSSSLLATTLRPNQLPKVFAETTPLAGEIATMVSATARVLSFDALPAKKGEWKESIALNSLELERQARLIDQYLQRDQLPLAVGLMEEWIVSWVLLRTGTAANWLKYHPDRRKAAAQLGALAAFAESGVESCQLTEQQKHWAAFWRQLTDLRNTLHHHGMRSHAVATVPNTLSNIVRFWDDVRTGSAQLPQLGGGKGRLLMTPVGNRHGVLFSAIRITQPDRCLAVCSEQSRPKIDDAIRHADFEGSLEILVVADAFSGFDEIPHLVNSAAPWLLEADSIQANLTGGTTLMGIVVQQLVEKAKQFARPTRRLVLVDRRPPDQQDSDPFVLSDHHWLDAPEENEIDR